MNKNEFANTSIYPMATIGFCVERLKKEIGGDL